MRVGRGQLFSSSLAVALAIGQKDLVQQRKAPCDIS
ncbi:hypothetical protein FHT77_004006 [Rhizobium sp. BK181]|nr:hypothetical protein [Rhizobium sp. BK181]